MTPLYLDSQEAVDAHNERVRVQREAAETYRRWSLGRSVAPMLSSELDQLFPFAQLRPSGFVGGSGARWEYREGILRRTDHEGVRRWTSLDPSDRAAASAALTGGVGVWNDAICRVTERLACDWAIAVRDHEPEIIAEAQALLDREGGK